MSRTLEHFLSISLNVIRSKVQDELEEARYAFKVNYNDRDMTPESYVSECMESLKQNFKQLMISFDRPTVRLLINDMLDQVLFDILENFYYNSSNTINDQHCTNFNTNKDKINQPVNLFQLDRKADWTQEQWLQWCNRLDWSAGQLTKSGVGRRATHLVIESLMNKLDLIFQKEPLSWHQKLKEQVLNISQDILKEKSAYCMEQVENSIKPYKFEVEFTTQEWDQGIQRSVKALKKQIQTLSLQKQTLEKRIGTKLLRNTKIYLDFIEKKNARHQEHLSATQQINKDEIINHPSVHPHTIELTKDYRKLEQKSHQLQRRLSFIAPGRGSLCQASNLPGCQPLCPEVYLHALSQKMTLTSVMFLWIELLAQYEFQWPRELDQRVRRRFVFQDSEMENFAKENQYAKSHLETVNRLRTLEKIWDKLRQIMKDH